MNGVCTVCGWTQPGYIPVSDDVIDVTGGSTGGNQGGGTPTIPSGETNQEGVVVIDEEDVPLANGPIQVRILNPAVNASASGKQAQRFQ